jgi:hypothetical protein
MRIRFPLKKRAGCVIEGRGKRAREKSAGKKNGHAVPVKCAVQLPFRGRALAVDRLTHEYGYNEKSSRRHNNGSYSDAQHYAVCLMHEYSESRRVISDHRCLRRSHPYALCTRHNRSLVAVKSDRFD